MRIRLKPNSDRRQSASQSPLRRLLQREAKSFVTEVRDEHDSLTDIDWAHKGSNLGPAD